jgi:hypothetical protein
MSLRACGLALLGLSMNLAQGPEAIGQPLAPTSAPALAVAEISYLLNAMGASGCAFYRNGSWYDSQTAQAHLQGKYARLLALDRIKTAEDFIDQAATRSSLSGKAYAVRCGQEASVSSSSWLYGLLLRYRDAAKPGAARDKRDTPGNRPLS